MSVRVRFAPSPTGLLHIGGARTALYSYLFAKANKGSYILRIEDTDLERSKREYEEKMLDDLAWCGLTHDEGPDCGGDFGPYRQSERLDLYKKYAWEFVEKGYAYPCFLSSLEIDELTQKAESEKKAPHYYHGQYRNLPIEDAKARIEKGDEYVLRFKNPGKKWKFRDIVRRDVEFPEDMVGDFVILRASGLPVYNFCCVIDDYLMKISHVIRAEEHLNNTCRQLMIYDALGVAPPEFAHVSLLVGEDRQKLSKRHGATSVDQYRQNAYLPQALMNYLCLLGWSHPEEKDIFNLDEIVSLFDLKRFSKSSALYDIKKLNFFNEQHLRLLEDDELLAKVSKVMPADAPFHQQSDEWKMKFTLLFREKLQLVNEYPQKLDYIFSTDLEQDDLSFKEALAWESTPQLATFLQAKLDTSEGSFLSAETLGDWMNEAKKELKIKGKFLFMGMRAILTGRTHGPDLKGLIEITPLELIKRRCESIKSLLR